MQAKRKHGAFYIPGNAVNRMADRARRDRPFESDQAFDRTRYEGAAWLSRFSQDDLAFCAARLDRELTAELGYDRVEGLPP